MKIACTYCKYPVPDPQASERNWTAYQCGNPESEYYHALLNVSPHGDMLKTITWTGCAQGKPKGV